MFPSVSAYNPANRRFSFQDAITMIKAVGDGVWVGTEKRTYFLAGTEPEKWHVAKEIPCGVTDGDVTQNPVSAADLSLQNVDGEGFLWLSRDGICWGGPGGVHVNFTNSRLDSSQMQGDFGAALEYGGRGIFTIEP